MIRTGHESYFSLLPPHVRDYVQQLYVVQVKDVMHETAMQLIRQNAKSEIVVTKFKDILYEQGEQFPLLAFAMLKYIKILSWLSWEIYGAMGITDERKIASALGWQDIYDLATDMESCDF